MTTEILYAIIIVALVVSGLFSLIKVVFLTIHANWEDNDGDSLEARAAAYVDKPGWNESISITRIFCNLVAGALGYVAVILHDCSIGGLISSYNNAKLGFVIYCIVATVVIYVLTVFVPNILGSLKPDTLVRVLAPLYKYLSVPVLFPARFANKVYTGLLNKLGYNPKLNFLSEERREALQSDMTASGDDDALEEDERQMVLNIFDFVETPVREIMTPRVDMCAIEAGTSLEETIKILNTERHSRLPVYRESIDNVIGILSSRDFLEWYTERGDSKFDLEGLVMPAFYVPYNKKIDDLLRELRKSGNQLAIVVDEYGGIAGLVTIEDIIEEIVGEIKDEDDIDEEAEIQKLKDGRYILDPLMTLSDLEYKLGVTLTPPENSHVETISGLIQATLGQVPSTGAEVSVQDYKFRVLKMDGVRMTKVMMIAPSAKH